MTQINLLNLGVAIPETADPDDIIKPNKVERLVLPGDVWKLGEHFVICGDATSPADLDRLLGGERPELLFTDPPYGMKKESDGVTNDREHKVCALDFDEKENKFIPVGHLEELRGYILEKEQEGNI